MRTRRIPALVLVLLAAVLAAPAVHTQSTIAPPQFAAGCTKGATLAAWARRRGYVPDEVMALGDNLNDLEMLEAAGLPVVMGNAVPALLARGWPITATNDEAGVADAIHRYVLRG